MGEGTAIITVAIDNGKKATCRITVPAAPRSVKFAKDSYTVKAGKTVRLSVKLDPAKSKTTLTFKSNKPQIATVDQNGVVKGLKKGTATITVKTANGLNAKIKVKVN